jgi:hypothetical protein
MPAAPAKRTSEPQRYPSPPKDAKEPGLSHPKLHDFSSRLATSSPIRLSSICCRSILNGVRCRRIVGPSCESWTVGLLRRAINAKSPPLRPSGPALRAGSRLGSDLRDVSRLKSRCTAHGRLFLLGSGVVRLSFVSRHQQTARRRRLPEARYMRGLGTLRERGLVKICDREPGGELASSFTPRESD